MNITSITETPTVPNIDIDSPLHVFRVIYRIIISS